MTYNDVLAKISSKHKNLIIDKYDVIDYCAFVVKQIGNKDFAIPYQDYELDIKNCRAKKPCNFFKLDYLLKNKVPVDSTCFHETAQFISFNNRFGKNIVDGQAGFTIDYMGFPVDEEGYPELATEQVSEACYWYWAEQHFFHDYISGDLSEGRYQRIVNNREEWMSEARGSLRRMNKNRMNKMIEIATKHKPSLIVPRGI